MPAPLPTAMNRLTVLPLALLTGCTLFGALSEEDQLRVDQFRAGAGTYFNNKQYEKAAQQALRGLEIDPQNYTLMGRLAWSYLQLSFAPSPENEQYLFQAEQAFATLMDERDVEDQEPKNVFGYAIALHNWARVEEDRAKQIRRESRQAEEAGASSRIARAEEHENRARHKDLSAQRYFILVADGSFTEPANKRTALKYLMAISYRHGDFEKAIGFGNRSLEENAKEVARWEEQYRLTQSPDRESMLRDFLAELKSDEIRVRSHLASYYRERATKTNSQQDYRAAAIHLDAILKARTNSAEDYYYRAVCYRALGEHAKARVDFKTFLSLDNHGADHPAVKDAREFVYGQGK